MTQIGLPFHTSHFNSVGETIIRSENADNKSHLYSWVPSRSTKIHTVFQKKYKTYQIARSFSLLFSTVPSVSCIYYYVCASDVSSNNIISYRKKKDRHFPISFT